MSIQWAVLDHWHSALLGDDYFIESSQQYADRGENVTGHARQRRSKWGKDRQEGMDVVAKQIDIEVEQLTVPGYPHFLSGLSPPIAQLNRDGNY